MAKTLAWVVGIVFVLVALLGFIGTSIVGPEGLFETNTLHDIVHLVSGIIFIVVALVATQKIALTFKVIGIVYLIVAVVGFIMVPQGGDILGLLSSNNADHWLHVVLGIVIAGLGFYLDKKSSSTMTPMM